jgi:hypothetical protein
MFHAFVPKTGYFVSNNFHLEPSSRVAIAVVLEEVTCLIGLLQAIVQDNDFFERSVGSCLRQSKLPKGVRRRLIKTSAGAIIIFW